VLFNLTAGAIRIIFFLVYIWAISFMKDVYRLFQYHGAEHKSIFCYEGGKELTLENIAGYFSATYERLCSLFGVTVKNPRECGGFGSFLLKQRLEDESRLYVGEAAGLQDLLWGFGMRHALVSGHLAGVSLSTGESYVRLVQQRLTGVMRTGVVNRFWVEHLKAYE